MAGGLGQEAELIPAAVVMEELVVRNRLREAVEGQVGPEVLSDMAEAATAKVVVAIKELVVEMGGGAVVEEDISQVAVVALLTPFLEPLY